MSHNLSEDEKSWLKELVENFEDEDKATRERQVRSWRRFKLLWDGFSRIWYSEVAHDWRIYDEQKDNDANQQDYYNKPINVFRAYLESIIAALSVTVPPIKCFPDDADNPLDLLTAKAGDKIGELISRHNDVSLLWIHALYIYCTEGMVAAYSYTREDESYGTYEEKKYEDTVEYVEKPYCSYCGEEIEDKSTVGQGIEDEFDPSISEEQELIPLEMQEEIPLEGQGEILQEPLPMGESQALMDSQLGMEGELPQAGLNQIQKQGNTLCPHCQEMMNPEMKIDKVKVTRLVGVFNKPKARQCIEVYGGLYIKVSNYAKKQEDCPYLIFAYETNYALARNRYPDIREKIQPGMSAPGIPYERWGRTNPQYQGEMPIDTVTCRNVWIRAAAFEYFKPERCDKLKKKFPDGVKVVMVEDEFAEAVNESLDDHWTLTSNPLSDFVYFDPIGQLLTSIQEITNDLISLRLQTIEHGIGQTFADPSVLNFDAYRQMETVPGGIYPATAKTGKGIGEGFFELRTATLSPEVAPFAGEIQEMGQLVSGAQPSLFGGQVGGSGTASEYSMQRSQSLQRLQTTWKMFTVWWKTIYGKVIPAYIKTVKDDQRIVKKDDFGNFINVLIRKSELEGKIGSIELEANENLPMTWSQRRDVIMKLLETNNQQLLMMIAQPENLPLIYEAIGVTDFYVPGEDDRNKQYNEIKQLLLSEPIPIPSTPEEEMMAMEMGQEVQEKEMPSVDVDPIMDNHQIEFEICRKWAVSEVGQLAKTENEKGYKNVLLHAMLHKNLIMPMMPEGEEGAAPTGNPKQDKSAPIKEDSNVASAV